MKIERRGLSYTAISVFVCFAFGGHTRLCSGLTYSWQICAQESICGLGDQNWISWKQSKHLIHCAISLAPEVLLFDYCRFSLFLSPLEFLLFPSIISCSCLVPSCCPLDAPQFFSVFLILISVSWFPLQENSIHLTILIHSHTILRLWSRKNTIKGARCHHFHHLWWPRQLFWGV